MCVSRCVRVFAFTRQQVIVVPVPRKVKDAESKEASSSAASSKGDAKSAGAGAAGESKNDGTWLGSRCRCQHDNLKPALI